MDIHTLTEEQINMELESRFSRTTGTLAQKIERLQRFLDIEHQKERRRRAICYHWSVSGAPVDTIEMCGDCGEVLYCEEPNTLVPLHQIIIELRKDMKRRLHRPRGDE